MRGTKHLCNVEEDAALKCSARWRGPHRGHDLQGMIEQNVNATRDSIEIGFQGRGTSEVKDTVRYGERNLGLESDGSRFEAVA
jgi:hypothetical protein